MPGYSAANTAKSGWANDLLLRILQLMTHKGDQQTRDYLRVERAIQFLHENFRAQPSLDEIAQAANLSPHHFQRLFTRWAGVSPIRFMQSLSLAEAKKALERSESVLDASLTAGLSGPGRLHDLFVTFEAMTPGDFKTQGEGLTVRYGVHKGPYGRFVIAITDRGICGLQFIAGENSDAALDAVRTQLPAANFIVDQKDTGEFAEIIFSPRKSKSSISISVVGTNFQIKVWRALLSIPEGSLVSYGRLAKALGEPKAARAVGSAVGANPVAYLIPCHRAIRATGLIDTQYRWGPARKLAMIGREAATKTGSLTPAAKHRA
jgi:AraC family transcriptional regulator of adaptative response/methylated-DNA-[protein]-cysteine methyltransferase